MLYLFWLLVRYLPLHRASTFGRKLFRWLGPQTSRQRRIRSNLELAFPDLGPDKIELLCRDVWGSFGSVLAEYPHLQEFAVDHTPSAIKLEIANETRTIVAKKEPAIYITAHLGNWELVGSTIAGAGVPLSVVYAPQNNPLLDRMIQTQRRSHGYRLIDKEKAMRQLFREIRSGRSVGMLPDQRLDTGELLPFFGRRTPTPTSPAWLSVKTNCPLIPVQIERIGNARYRAVFHKPIQTNTKSSERENILQLTTAINRLFEDWIRQQPGQWLCMKRRWPEAAYSRGLQNS